MALIHVIRQDIAQALSNKAVWTLIVVIGLACLAPIGMTMTVLVQAGYWWLALLIVGPLGTGLGHTSSEWIRYCRPQWFKPKKEL
jgi:predicted cobalt transporter CbtA